MFTIHLNTGSQLKLNGQHLNTGGQGQIYQCLEQDGKHYLVKAMFNEDSIFKRLHAAKTRLNSKLPLSLNKRSFPIGQGYCSPQEIGITSAKGIYLLAFDWLDAESLDLKFRIVEDDKVTDFVQQNNIPYFNVRKKIAMDIAEALMLLENAGIVHGDLYPDNFMVDPNNQVHLIDLEGCGISHKYNQWLYHPIASGKRSTFPYPPSTTGEYKTSHDAEGNTYKYIKTSAYTDRWTGLSLIWYVLTSLPSPFVFLKNGGESNISALQNAAQNSPPQWIPVVSNFDKWSTKCTPQHFQAFFNQHFLPDFGKLLHKTFITGFNNPSQRSTFKEIYAVLKKMNSVPQK